MGLANASWFRVAETRCALLVAVTSYSVHSQAIVLLCLLVMLVVLVVGQLVFERVWPVRECRSGAGGRHWVVFVAGPAVLGGLLVGGVVLLPFAIVNAAVVRIGSQGFQDVFVVAWLVFWGLSPSLVLGYVSGRWWSFTGAAPVLVLLPFSLLVGSSGNQVTGGDVFLTLPVAAAVAVALSLGSAGRLVRQRGQPSPQPKQRAPQTVATHASSPSERAFTVRVIAAPSAIRPRGPEPVTPKPTRMSGTSASRKPVVPRTPHRQARAVWGLAIGSVWAFMGVAGGLTVAPGDGVDFVIGWVLVAGPIALAIWWLAIFLRSLVQHLRTKHHGGPPAAVH